MAASLVLPFQIFRDQLSIPHGSETWEVPAMHDADGQCREVFQRRYVVGLDRMVGIVDQRPVIDDVA